VGKRITAYGGTKKYAFVSYSHEDADLVYAVISRLHDMGYNIWYDEGIPLTMDYGEELFRHIVNCEVFILFVSRHSVASAEVDKEVRNALAMKKNVLRINIDESALPYAWAYHLPQTEQYISIEVQPDELYARIGKVIAECRDSTAAQSVGQTAYRGESDGLFCFRKVDYGYAVCSYLGEDNQIIIPRKYNGKPVIEISDRAFENCTELTSVLISDSVKKIWFSAFHNCENLTSVHIPNSVERIYGSVFSNCKNLNSIVIPDGVTTIDEALFCGCESLTEVGVPDSVTGIGDYAFSNCKGLISIPVSPRVCHIGRSAFKGCTGLVSIVIPDSVTKIDEGAFRECTGLKAVVLSERLTCVESFTFSKCTNLTSIHIPDSVTQICGFAFYDCKSLIVTAPHTPDHYGYTPDSGVTWVVTG